MQTNPFFEFQKAFYRTCAERGFDLDPATRSRLTCGLSRMPHWWRRGVDPVRRIRAAEDLAVRLVTDPEGKR